MTPSKASPDTQAPSAALRAPLALFALGVAVSALAGLWQQHANTAFVQQRLHAAAEHAAERLRRRMQTYEYGLLATRSAVLAAGENVEALSRDQFRRFGASLDLARQFPGARGFVFIRRVPEAQLAAFEAAQRREGFPDFRVHQLQPHGGERFVVQYAEPLQGNAQALGFDIASDPMRRDNALAALHSGEPRLTPPLLLPQAQGSGRSGFALLLPVYRSVAPPPTAQRDAQTFGWTAVTLVVEEVLRGFDDAGEDAVALALSDATPPGAVQRFHVSRDWRDGAVPQAQAQVTLPLYGRQWQVAVQPQPPFVAQLRLRDPLELAALGVAVSGLLGLLLAGLQRAARRERVIQEGRERLAAVVESSHDAIVGHDAQDRVTSWNPAAERLLGWNEQEALGHDLCELTVPARLHAQARQVRERVWRGEDVPPFDTERLDRDGQVVEVSLSVAPTRGPHGQVTAAASTLRDLRPQRAAQARIVELNVTLEQQVQQRTDELRTILASAASAIISTDLAGRITLFNPAAEAMLGLPAAQALGREMLDFCDRKELERDAWEFPAVVHEHAQQLPGWFQAALRRRERVAGAPQRAEWTYVRRDGTRFPGLLSVSLLRDGHGRPVGFLAVIVDLSERRAMEKALRRRQAELEALAARERAILAGAGSAIVVTDANDRITLFNAAAERLSGHAAAQALGRSATALLFDPADLRERHRELQAAFGRALAPGEVFMARTRGGDGGQWQLLRADGSRVPVLLEVRSLPGGAAHGGGLIYVAVDLSERQRLERALQQRTSQAEAANRAKSAFLANMSHEIRTPLNAVIGLSHLLQQQPLEGRQREFVGHIAGAGQQLLGLVNDVLDLSKIEAGEMTLEQVPFELAPLLGELMAQAGVQATSKGLELRLEAAPELPPRLRGDPVRLKQVLGNLLGNAVKFTERGGVTLRAQLHSPSEGDAGITAPAQGGGSAVVLRFEVQDSGIGIAPQVQAHIFEPFTQADSSTTRRFGGTGLGLSIVRRLVGLMGGTLALHSVPGEGSVFTVTVALETAAERE